MLPTPMSDYVFAVLGMEMFGGKIRGDNPLIRESLFTSLRYYDMMHFNTLGNSLLTLFHIMVTQQTQQTRRHECWM